MVCAEVAGRAGGRWPVPGRFVSGEGECEGSGTPARNDVAVVHARDSQALALSSQRIRPGFQTTYVQWLTDALGSGHVWSSRPSAAKDSVILGFCRSAAPTCRAMRPSRQRMLAAVARWDSPAASRHLMPRLCASSTRSAPGLREAKGQESGDPWLPPRWGRMGVPGEIAPGGSRRQTIGAGMCQRSAISSDVESWVPFCVVLV